MAKKPSLGRQKIKIAKIEKPNHRQVTFSKRRSGLFKKACELCTLCGVEIAIVVFSPANKVFSFGHPNVESLVDRFLGKADVSGGGAASSANASVRELNAQLTHVNNLIDAEKERKESLERVKEWWWEAPVEKLGKSELEELSASLEELKKAVALQAKLVNETTSSSGAGMGRMMEPFETKPATEELMYGFSNFAGHHGFGSL